MDIARMKPQATPTRDHRDDPRAEELNKLRLALATFALQLDAFEMRTSGVALRMGMTPRMPVAAPDTGRRLQRDA
jgi:hypothetical protein